MDEKAALREIGLNSNEADVYLALLHAGPSGAGKIGVKTGIHRRTVYDTLESLQKKGLAGSIRIQGKQVFQASPPAQLESFMEEKNAALRDALPKLQKLAASEEDTQISVLRGKAGLKSILRDVLSVRQTLHIFGGQMQIVGALGSYFEWFTNERKRLGIHQKIVLLDLVEVRARAAGLPLLEAKFIDPANSSQVVYWFYGDRLVLIVWKAEPEVVRIVSKEYVKAFQKSFDLAWQSDSQVYHGYEGIKAIFEDTLNYPEALYINGAGWGPHHMWDYFEKRYIPEALKRGHKWRNIVNRKNVKPELLKIPFHARRYFPRGFAAGPSVVWIWGDKVANVVWLPEPIVFVLENKAVNRAQRDYFEFLWNKCERI